MGNTQSGSPTSPSNFVRNVNEIAEIVRDQSDILSLIRKEVGKEIISDMVLDEFLTMVNNRMVLVPIIGEGSSGKSTLIDAFLGDKFLPFGCPKVTATRTYIKHDPKIHRGPCKGKPCQLQDCPKLYTVLEVSEGTEPLAEGVSEIREMLLEYNKKASENSDAKDVPNILLITANISMFEAFAKSPLVHYLVDCPGLEYLKNEMEKYITIVSAVIYTHNYKRFLQNPRKIKRDLIEKPKCAKVLFAVAHFDAFYEPGNTSDQNPNQELVKAQVAKTFPGIIAKEDVFPVSGRWALFSRILDKTPDDSDAKFIVNHAYTVCSRKKGCDVDEDSSSKVLEKSEIRSLEERVEEVLSGIDHHVWTDNIKAKCEEFLSRPINKGEKKLAKMAAKIKSMLEEANADERHLRMLDEQRQVLQDSTDFKVVTKEFQEDFDVEDVLMIIEEEFIEVAKHFIGQYKNRLPLPLEQFENDLRELETSVLPVKIKDVFMQKANELLQNRLMRLNTAYCTLEANTTQYINKTSARLRNKFGHYCQVEARATTKPNIKVITAATELRKQHKSFKRKHYALAGAIVAAGIGITSLPISSMLVLGITSLGTISSGLIWLYRTWNKVPILSSISELEQAEKKLQCILSQWLAKNEAYCKSTCLVYSQDVAQKVLQQSNNLLASYEEKWNKPLRESRIQIKKLFRKIEGFQQRESALKEAVQKLKNLQLKLRSLKLDYEQDKEEVSTDDGSDMDWFIVV